MNFPKFQKISRLSRECVITEKIDGTNGLIFITDFNSDKLENEFVEEYSLAQKDNLYIFAGSRNRWIIPGKDNYGFANWVQENSEELFSLGIGSHYGERWGLGVQRNYGMKEKVFSLFNNSRWADTNEYECKTENCKQDFAPKCCRVVPILYTGMFDTEKINWVLNDLKISGSIAAPGFMNPEGIVIFHSASGKLFKKTIENDEKPKSIIKHK